MKIAKLTRLFWAAALALPTLTVGTQAADLTTNDVLLLADTAKNAFHTGFNIGVPILILLMVLGWLLLGIRTGIKGRK